MIKEVLAVIIFLLAFPVGYYLAYLCKDELVAGRKWFKIISIACFIGIFFFLLLIQNVRDVRIPEHPEVPNSAQGLLDFTIVFTLIFMAMISLICLRMSYNKKFLGRYGSLKNVKSEDKLCFI